MSPQWECGPKGTTSIRFRAYCARVGPLAASDWLWAWPWRRHLPQNTYVFCAVATAVVLWLRTYVRCFYLTRSDLIDAMHVLALLLLLLPRLLLSLIHI